MAEVRADNVVRNSHRIRLLHLSDLHESVALDWMKEERRAKIARTRAQRYRVLSGNFFETLRSIQKQRPVDMVCFTGDVADWGLKEEYERATERFKFILNTLGLPADRLFVVPGNHDVNRGIEADAWQGIRELGDAQALSNWMGGEEPPKGAEGAWRDKILSRTRAFRDWLEKMGRGDLLPEASSHRRLGYRKTLTLGAVTRCAYIPSGTFHRTGRQPRTISGPSIATCRRGTAGRTLSGRSAVIRRRCAYIPSGTFRRTGR
jgi:Calcineurin-like phosphoesterase